VIQLNTQKLHALIDNVGGMASLMDRWGERFTELPNRDTFYSWRTGPRFSGNLTSYLRLCACLDVDPIAVISADKLSSASFGDNLLMLALGSPGGRGIKVTDVLGIFGPVKTWPSSKEVTEAYGNDWFRSFFKNEGSSKSHYELLRLCFDVSFPPRVAHFAYRVTSAERWRMYGSVGLDRNDRFLIHLYGKNQTMISDDPSKILVETRFGEGPCEFCVASLHHFDITVLGAHDGVPALRFTS
jgi:hypothetical protein